MRHQGRRRRDWATSADLDPSADIRAGVRQCLDHSQPQFVTLREDDVALLLGASSLARLSRADAAARTIARGRAGMRTVKGCQTLLFVLESRVSANCADLVRTTGSNGSWHGLAQAFCGQTAWTYSLDMRQLKDGKGEILNLE